VQEEEAGQAELVDQLQLFVEPRLRFTAQLVTVRVAVLERALADVRELHDRRLGAVGEVGIAIAELFRQVEAKPLGELDRTSDGVAVLRETLDDLTGREQHGLVVAAPFGLAPVERAAVANGDEHVLQRRAARMVRVHVSRDEGRHSELLRELAKHSIAARVAALVWALQLDEEAVGAERLCEPRGRVRVADGEAVARTTREADEAFVQLFEQPLVERGVSRWLALLAERPRVRVRGGEQAAEVGVALLRLDEQRHMRPVGERDLRAGDRTNAEVLRRVRELERAVDTVVVGERKRRVAELGRLHRELLR
jgi:hypothetical protein